MDPQSIAAIAIAAVAAAWLAWRWWKHGFDDDAKGCAGCDVVKPVEQKSAGPSRSAMPRGGPASTRSEANEVRGP